MTLTIGVLPPESREWEQFVRDRGAEMIAVLAAAYGAKDRGEAVHRSRIEALRSWLVIATDPSNRIVGCSYIHQSGKRGATGVLPPHRRQGLGRRLIASSLRRVPDQWTEIDAADVAARALFESAGFHTESDWRRIEALLGPLLSPLVTGHSARDGYQTYVRQTFDLPRLTKTFVVMVHGNPRARTHHDGTNYIPITSKES